VVIGTDCIDSYKSNYHPITTKTAPDTEEAVSVVFFILSSYGFINGIQLEKSGLINLQNINISESENRGFSLCLFVCLMVFNATFNTISVISWRSLLLVEETGEPGENHQPAASY